MGALSDYQAQVQDLLHDPLAQQWPVSSLPGYINEARNRVAQDTRALRQVLTPTQFPSLSFSAGTEFVTPQTFLPAPYGALLVDVLNITIIINQARGSMLEKPYSWLTAQLRGWVNYQSYPLYYAKVSPIQICIAPVPNQAYTCEWDIAINPNKLLLDTDLEQIPAPFTEPVQYYAAYKAKLNQQSQGEADMFMKMYISNLRRCVLAYRTRILGNPYLAP